MPKDLTALFYPKSVAVIGASRSPEKVGAIVLKNIVGSKFSGKVYPVNPNAETIEGLTCFKDVLSLPEVPDLAVVAVPSGVVLEVLKQVGEKGIKNVVVYSAGFKEIGEEGEKLEQELSLISQNYDFNLLGPNCLGFVNNLCPINATFGQPVDLLGNLRFISQSGAIAASLFDWCESTSLGFSNFITLGNKAVLNENDILSYFQGQTQSILSDQKGLSNVWPIGLYLEALADGTEFLHIASQISKNSPIFVLKPGKTPAAAKAMQSHTGAIAGEDAVLEAVLKQAGVIRCQTLEDFFDMARAFAWEDAPSGPKVAVISNAGGPAVISADAVIKEDLELAEFDTETKTKLAEVLPRSASIINPVDVLGDALADRFLQAAEIILQTDQANALVVILTPQIMTQIEKTAELIGGLSDKYKKPIFCSFIGGNLVYEGEQVLNKYKIPSFRFPERAIAAVGAMWRWNSQRREDIRSIVEPSLEGDFDKARDIVLAAVKEGQKTLDNVSAGELLASVGIPTPSSKHVESLDQAKTFALENGWPLVLKLSSPGLLHKKDIGGVITDIGNEDMLEDAWYKLERKITQLDEAIQAHIKVQIQKEILNGVEVIVGVKKDPAFGLVLLFGAGGSFAEIINDRNLRLLPMDRAQAVELVEESKVYKVLKGHESEPSYALDKLYDLLAKFAKLAEALPEVSEIEINPAIVTLNDVWAVDGKVVLEEGEKKPVSAPKLKVAVTLEHEILVAKYHSYTFESEEPLIFNPGQYISVKVAPEAVRSYSIAGHDGSQKFNLLVDTTPGGPGSKFFENLKVGDKIPYLGPFGSFTLNLKDGAKHILFLATGCGCSPIKAMIDAALKEEKTTLSMTLYFGLRCAGDAFWEDYFKNLAQEYPNFSFKLAADKGEEGWGGYVGFITDLVKKDFPDAGECSAYLCGSKPMIDNATKLLGELGMPPERIYTEKL